MNTITQDMRFKQAVIEYTLKHGVTTAAIRYKTSRQNIYRWRKKYDGTVHSLAEGSHRPHSHPNQHTEEEIKLVKNIRRRNPHAGLVVFWVKLRQRGYTRSISGPHTRRNFAPWCIHPQWPITRIRSLIPSFITLLYLTFFGSFCPTTC